MALSIIVIYFGLFLYVGNFGKYGDFSYGIYILHFPIIQFLLSRFSFKENPYLFLFTVLTITTMMSVMMWHLVEKHFIARRNL